MKMYRIFTFMLVMIAALAFFGCQSQELTSGKVYVQQQDYAKAEYNFLKALDVEPENPEVPYLLAVEIYGNNNSGLTDYTSAKEYLDMALERDPDYLPENVKIFKEQLYGYTFNAAVKQLQQGHQERIGKPG
ncbi:MAG: hypothetical protein U5N26_03735 [Candidatus Marinimicrobia bacterium]|nr:hypothetical protein [Candidatus Neomarinimicrobiota bacterium]